MGKKHQIICRRNEERESIYFYYFEGTHKYRYLILYLKFIKN